MNCSVTKQVKKKVGYLSVSNLVTSKHFLSVYASIEGSD